MVSLLIKIINFLIVAVIISLKVPMKSSKPRSFWRNYIFDYGVILLLFRLKVYDEYNDEEVEVTKKELKLINRLLKGKAPHSDFDPYAVCSCHSFCALQFQMDVNIGFWQMIYLILCLKFKYYYFSKCSHMLIGLNGMMPSIHSQMHRNRRGGSFLQNGKVRRYGILNVWLLCNVRS